MKKEGAMSRRKRANPVIVAKIQAVLFAVFFGFLLAAIATSQYISQHWQGYVASCCLSGEGNER